MVLLIVEVIALAAPLAELELGLDSDSGWHCPAGEEYHPVSLLPRVGFPRSHYLLLDTRWDSFGHNVPTPGIGNIGLEAYLYGKALLLKFSDP